jgi:hypothetical protein
MERIQLSTGSLEVDGLLLMRLEEEFVELQSSGNHSASFPQPSLHSLSLRSVEPQARLKCRAG